MSIGGRKGGFTLLEVLTVVIIAILVTLFAIPVYKKSQTKNNYLAASGVLVDLANAARMLQEEYPTLSLESVGFTANASVTASAAAAVPTQSNVIGWLQKNRYLSEVPFSSGSYKGYSYKFSTASGLTCAKDCGGKLWLACMSSTVNPISCAWVDKSGNLHHN